MVGWSVARRAYHAELVLGVRVGRTVGLGGCVGAGRGGFPGVETLLEPFGGHFDGERTGLADEAKLGGETDRSAYRAGQEKQPFGL